MIVFKKRKLAQSFCNSANKFPWFNLMVTAVPGGWTLTPRFWREQLSKGLTMATKGVNAPEAKLYLSGLSIPQVSAETGIPLSTLRFRFKKLGILRSREEAVKMAADDGRLGSGMRGKTRSFSDDHKENIRQSLLQHGEKNAKGTTLKPSGYVEYTRGPRQGQNCPCRCDGSKVRKKT